MKEGFCSLGSGSKGNSLFFGTKKSKVLIDAGLSGRAIKTRLAELEIEIDEIEAILISHEHSDHIQGLKVLAFKHNIPVFANAKTAQKSHATLGRCPKFKVFTTGETFYYKDLVIHPFSIQHDTVEPVAFTIETDGVKVGICTDLGFATTLVEVQLQNCDYLHLEANHEPSYVMACPRPPVYKQRVLGRNGHLSNDSAATLVERVYHPNLKEIHLAHLSEECNHPKVALNTVAKKLQEKIDQVKLCVAPQRTLGEKVLF